jgi:hypothetical protein
MMFFQIDPHKIPVSDYALRDTGQVLPSMIVTHNWLVPEAYPQLLHDAIIKLAFSGQ